MKATSQLLRRHFYDSGGPEYDDYKETHARGRFSFSKKIRSLDAFGHEVHLNIDSKGPKHKTMCGALVTIAMCIIVVLYLILHIFILRRGDVQIMSQAEISRPFSAT